MNDQDFIYVSNARTRINAVRTMAVTFLVHTAKSAPTRISAQLQVKDGVLTVLWESSMATATGRPVRASDGEFRLEYIFRVLPVGELDEVEVARFYLDPGGKVFEDADGTKPICDYDNSYLADHICGRVVLGMLARLYEPAP